MEGFFPLQGAAVFHNIEVGVVPNSINKLIAVEVIMTGRAGTFYINPILPHLKTISGVRGHTLFYPLTINDRLINLHEDRDILGH